MTEVSPRQQRLERIEQMMPEADRLAGIVRHATLRDMVQTAVRDLEAGVVWLNQPQVEGRRPVLHIVDLIIELADWR